VKWDARTVRLFSEGQGGGPRGGWDGTELGCPARSMTVVIRRAGVGESASERDLQPRGFLHLFGFHSPASLSLSSLKKEMEKKEPDSENGEL
jgi:hypothetical protein